MRFNKIPLANLCSAAYTAIKLVERPPIVKFAHRLQVAHEAPPAGHSCTATWQAGFQQPWHFYCKLRAVSKRLVVGTCGTFCATAWYRYRVVSRCPRHAISNALRRGNHRTAASFSVSQWLPSRHRTIAWYAPQGCGSKNIAQPRGNEYHTPWYMRKISASKTSNATRRVHPAKISAFISSANAPGSGPDQQRAACHSRRS